MSDERNEGVDTVVQNAIEGRPPGYYRKMLQIEKKIVENYLKTKQWVTL